MSALTIRSPLFLSVLGEAHIPVVVSRRRAPFPRVPNQIIFISARAISSSSENLSEHDLVNLISLLLLVFLSSSNISPLEVAVNIVPKADSLKPVILCIVLIAMLLTVFESGEKLV